MKNIKPAFLLFFVITCATCAFGQVWKPYTNSAKVFQEQKKMHIAIEFYSKAKEELKRDSLGTISYALSCTLGNLYLNMGQYEKAESLHLEAKQIREKVFGKEHAAYAASCNSLWIRGSMRNQNLYSRRQSKY